MFPNWWKLHENMFFCSCPRMFQMQLFWLINYLDIRKSVFLITKNFIHQKSEKVSTGEYVFLLLIQKCWNVEKNNLPFPKRVHFQVLFQFLFDLSTFLMMVGQRHCSQSPSGVGGGWEGCAGALGVISCIDTTLLPGELNWTTGNDPGLYEAEAEAESPSFSAELRSRILLCFFFLMQYWHVMMTAKIKSITATTSKIPMVPRLFSDINSNP